MSQDSSPVSEATWRNRFIAINVTRIGGTVLALFGLVVWQGDLLREGGWPAVGIPMTLVGLLVAFVGARWLISRWRTPPAA